MTSAAAPAKVARPRILVVDDDYLVAAATSGSLQDGGFEVLETAASAEEAIALARSEHPLLILMDIRLAGGRDGIDAALEIFRSLGIRCIFATAHADPVTRARAEPAAPLGWLPKPYAMEAAVAVARAAVAQLTESG